MKFRLVIWLPSRETIAADRGLLGEASIALSGSYGLAQLG